MIIGNKRDLYRKIALVSSYEYERYNSGEVAQLLGYEASEAEMMSHQGIDVNAFIGRDRGECSLILADSVMERMDTVIFSQKLSRDLRRKNAVVSYAFGNKVFWCAQSNQFMDYYTNLYADKIRETFS